jgi:GNAT superfamily N-acetyltransferase
LSRHDYNAASQRPQTISESDKIIMAQIATATLEDIPQLCGLLSILFAQEVEFAPESARQVAGLRQIIEHPESGRILVLREGGILLGMANLLFTVSTARGGRVAILDDFVVRPERRGQGAGSALLKAARALAEAEDCSRISLQTDASNDAAMRLYRRHGFAQSTMVPFRLLIPEE